MNYLNKLWRRMLGTRAGECALLTKFCAAFTLSCLVTLNTFAQDTRAQQIESEKIRKAAAIQPEQREKGDRIITRLEHLFTPEPPDIRPTVGNFVQGAGFALGAAVDIPVAETGLWTTQAAWSVNNFKQAQTALTFPPAVAGRLAVVTTAEWNDAPDLPFYGIGNNTSRNNKGRYGLRWFEGGVQTDVRPYRSLHFGGGLGYLTTRSSATTAEIFTTTEVPGIGAGPDWIHSRASASIDTRESPGYTRRGGFYGFAFHRYQDPNGKFSFNRSDIDVRQFVPLLHNNWIIAVQGRAELTNSADSQTIPYFMLPYLGGRDGLRGFDPYRFADKDSLLLRAELRWTPSPVVDMAVFSGGGKVAGKVQDLDLHHLHKDAGFGIRFHGATFTALRLEVARSVEGWRFTAAHSISF
jgi:hypothetical protein